MSRVYAREANGQFASTDGERRNPFAMKTAGAYRAKNKRLNARLKKVQSERKNLDRSMRDAVISNDFDEYEKLKLKEKESLTVLRSLKEEVSYTSRSYDGTEEGLAALRRQAAKAEGKEKEKLLLREKQAKALNFARHEAERLYENEYKPLLRIA